MTFRLVPFPVTALEHHVQCEGVRLGFTDSTARS
jgi:hypothetical protein